MIIEKNCLFLFKGDLSSKNHYDNLNPNNIELKHFIKSGDDIIEWEKLLMESKLISYIDSEKRIIKYFSGGVKGHLENY